MKKIKLFGLIAAALLVFTLSGCDAILEAVYPAYGDQFGGGGSGNNISIFVEVIPGEEVGDPQIAVRVQDRFTNEHIADAFVWPFWNWDESGNLFLTANVELFGIPGDDANPREYRVVAWLEKTTDNDGFWISNGKPDPDEPQREAEWGSEESKSSVFNFPNDDGTNWIHGEAFLEMVEGAIVNRDFFLTGQQVFHEAELTGDTSYDSKNYSVTPEDPEQNITAVNYTLWGPDGIEASAGSLTTSFTIDYSFASSSADYYWLEVEVEYDDGWYEYKGFRVRVLTNEAGASLNYVAAVTIDSVEGFPLELNDYSVVDINWSAGSSFGTISDVSVVNIADPGDPQWLRLSFDTGSLNYDPTEYTDGIDGVDVLYVGVDADQNGDDDFYTEVPLGVSNDDEYSGTVDIPLWVGDFRHIF